MKSFQSHNSPQFSVKLASSDADLTACQRLRYDVFVKELGSDGPLVEHEMQLERDEFDAVAGHFLLFDNAIETGSQLIGCYRFMSEKMAAEAGGFYCEDQYDLTLLRKNGGRLLELGRSCLRRDYRGGAAMLHLWAALTDFVAKNDIDTMFGVGSFHGTDPAVFAHSLSLLHHRHLAPASLLVPAVGRTAMSLDIIAADDLDRLEAVRSMPALIKAYLRLGASVGEGAFVDHAFQTTDVCVILQRGAVNAMQKAILARGQLDG